MAEPGYVPFEPGAAFVGAASGIDMQRELPVRENVDERSAEIESDSHVQILTSDDPIIGEQVKAAAQKLHTDVYLKHGFITEEDLTGDLYADQYVQRSRYYLVRNGRKIAAARQIPCDKDDGILSLPTTHYFSVDPDKLAEVAGVDSVAAIRPREAVEISGLVSEKLEGGVAGDFDAVLALYSSMLRTSLEDGHKLWLMNIEPPLLTRLKFLVGAEQTHILGEPREYMGPATTPVAINPQSVVRQILASGNTYYINHLRAVLDGVSDRRIPGDIRKLMDENGIAAKRYPAVARAATNPQVLFQAGVMAYSASRAFPAADLKQFDGNVGALWGIDVATSIPYAYGLTKMYAARTVGGKALGAALAIPTFLAPYAYFYAESGKEYPAYVNGIVAALVSGAAIKEAVTRRLRHRKEVRISEGLRNLPELTTAAAIAA